MAVKFSYKQLIGIFFCTLWVNANLPEARADSDVLSSTAIFTENTLPLLNSSTVSVQRVSPVIDFQDQRLSGLTYLKATSELRVRGWEIRDNFYFGQTKVGNKWGLGILIERDSFVYGINNRGIQILKRL